MNLAQLIRSAVIANPGAVYGTFQQSDRLDHVVDRADRIGEALRSSGFARGDVVAVIGTNCAAYIVFWLAAQLIGLRTALINPSYPDELLALMLQDLRPRAIIWISRDPGAVAAEAFSQFDASQAWDGRISALRPLPASPASDPLALDTDCPPETIAAYLHTSGTSGNPKFCALSHVYFIRLGRFFGDALNFSRHDTVVNPLPLFHINPTGNGLVGALTAAAGFLSTERFVASEFWPMVKQHGATVLVLHAPPASLLKAKTTAEDARGHKVRIGFACDPEFLRQFDVPIGVGGYGSTEAGGLCHTWKFRETDTDFPAEGALHLAGQPRYDLDCRLAEEDEILVREKAPHVLFDGYARGGAVVSGIGEDGWFHTGDRGRFDHFGNLIFIERISESIRVNAEYVPIDFVEERLRLAPSLGEFALWRVDSPSRGHQAVVYTTSAEVNPNELCEAMSGLPKYMWPTQIIGIAEIPRDAGVGKVQRRRLGEQPTLYTHPL